MKRDFFQAMIGLNYYKIERIIANKYKIQNKIEHTGDALYYEATRLKTLEVVFLKIVSVLIIIDNRTTSK
jgi:hypothetical protein